MELYKSDEDHKNVIRQNYIQYNIYYSFELFSWLAEIVRNHCETADNHIDNILIHYIVQCSDTTSVNNEWLWLLAMPVSGMLKIIRIKQILTAGRILEGKKLMLRCCNGVC